MDSYDESVSNYAQTTTGTTITAKFCAIVVGVILSLIILISISIMVFTHGHFIYALDDPYISLALAWHISQGHYGINAAEVSSPSSSILFPFLLAGFGWSSFLQFVPLVVNTLASLATAALFALAASRYSVVARPADLPRGAFLLIILCIATNMVGLVFVGLEHSLHVLTSVAVVFGLARTLEEDEEPVWLAPAIVLLPLWRFEGMALAAISLAILSIYRKWRTVTLSVLGLTVIFGAYAAFMRGLGLPIMPSSVLVKLPSTSGGGWSALTGFLADAVGRVREYDQSVSLFLIVLLILAHPVCRFLNLRGFRGAYRLTPGREALFAIGVAAALLAHALFGTWGWFSRYEVYAVESGVAAAFVLWHGAIADLVQNGRTWMIGVAGALLILINNQYVKTTLQTPLVSRGIYEQQYQLHLFVTKFYKQPVAVNDLGWISYRNPNYVLDLWGLGSEEARRARLVSHEPGWMDRLVQSHHVGLAIVYADWFDGDIPSNWKRIATLQSTHYARFVGGQQVAFFSTSPLSEPIVAAALRRFAAVSEPAAKITFAEESPSAQANTSP